MKKILLNKSESCTCISHSLSPLISISTDDIVGYPTETEDDFEKTIALLKETRPDIINHSRYSQRPGTDAAEMPQIDMSEIKRRSKKLFELVNEISYSNNKNSL